MANQTVYPYGTGGSLPASIGIINDVSTGGADKALSAEMGVYLNGRIDGVFFPVANLYNPTTDTTGKYINSSGGISTGENYDITDYIPVTAGDKYCLTGMFGNIEREAVTSSVYVNYYDSSKTLIATEQGGGKVFTAPSGAEYMRASIGVGYFTDIRIEQGDRRNYPSDKIKNSVNKFESSRNSGTVAASGFIKLPLSCHISKNTTLVARINGTISSVLVGVGVNGTNGFNYLAYWVEVTQTQAKLYWYNSATSVLLETYSHGLTLTTDNTISVITTVDGSISTKLKIVNNLGSVFEQELPSWGVGVCFVKNGNSSGDLDVDLSFMVRDITKQVWLFGDSYVNLYSEQRWPYYLVGDKLTDWLCNSQPGMSGADAYTDLVSVLGLGHIPSIIVWTLGMNGNNDTTSGGDYVIASSQKSVIDNVVSLCEANNITLVLGTVPTVPARQRTGFCNYVRSLGVRYIDFAAAVGATSAGVWNTGLLNTADNTHPTAAGAKVLAARALLDCPELSIKE